MIFRRDRALLKSTLVDAPRYPIGDFAVRAVGKPHVLGPTGAVRQPLAVLYGRTPSTGPTSRSPRPRAVRPTWSGLNPSAFPDPHHLRSGPDRADPVHVRRLPDRAEAPCLHRGEAGRGQPPVHRPSRPAATRGARPRLARGPQRLRRGLQLRRKHPWPPAVTVYPSWIEAYAASAVANDFPVTDVDEASAKVTKLIARIAIA